MKKGPLLGESGELVQGFPTFPNSFSILILLFGFFVSKEKGGKVLRAAIFIPLRFKNVLYVLPTKYSIKLSYLAEFSVCHDESFKLEN